MGWEKLDFPPSGPLKLHILDLPGIPCSTDTTWTIRRRDPSPAFFFFPILESRTAGPGVGLGSGRLHGLGEVGRGSMSAGKTVQECARWEEDGSGDLCVQVAPASDPRLPLGT